MRKLLRTCILLLIMCVGYAANLSAQTVSGVITENGAPVIGATVIVQGTTNGSITDIDGKYTISNLKDGDVLEYSYVGMTPQSQTYSGQTAIDISLEADSTKIDDIVVVGFGSQKKVNLTGSVAVVDSEALADRPVSSAAEMLQGVVPGLNISNSSGTSMADDATMNIRGTGTIGTGSTGAPLILIDGMEGDFNSLNPQDIESISVLKDAASSSIYGARAPFGVILITTKKGSEGKVSVNYNNSFRFSTPSNLPTAMDSYSFALMFNDAGINNGQQAYFSEQRLADIQAYQRGEIKAGQYVDPNDSNFWGEGYLYGISNTDHYKTAYQDWATSQEHNVSAQGGTEKLNFYMSASHLSKEGFLEVNTENLKRLTTTTKINAKFYDWMTLNSTTRYVDINYNFPTNLKSQAYTWSNNFPSFFKGLGAWPTAPDYDPNGNLYASTARGVGNSVFSLQGGDSWEDRKYLYQQFQLTLEPIKGWKTFIDYNYRFSDTEKTAQLINTNNVGVDNATLYPVCVDSYVEEYRYSSDYNNLNIYSEYSKQLNKHSFKGMVGFQSESNYFGDIDLRRDGLIVDELVSIDTTNGIDATGSVAPPVVGGAYNNWSTAGFFGRINYNYDERYLVEFSGRYDGTSRFVGDSRWGFFPSGSIGWNIARERFFEPLADKIGNMKLRASYGELGNQNTNSLYPTYSLMNIKTSSGAYLINNAKPTTTTEPGLIDPYLTWERIKNLNVGVDISAFDNRLNLSADYFIRKTTGMVGPAETLPDVFGTNVPKQNNTDLSTRGYEITLSWRDRLQSGFSYGVSASLSDDTTTIDYYSNPTGLISTYNTGREIGEIWGYETIGIAKSQEEMDAHLATTSQSSLGSKWAAGDIMYRDLNGDGTINGGAGTLNNPGDKRVIGNSAAHYMLSFSFDTSYKGFDLRAFFQGVLKRDYWLAGNAGAAYTGGYFWGVYGGMWNSLGLVGHEDYFREDPNHPLGQNLDSYYPRANFETSRKNNQVQTRYLADAGYLRLKNLQIGYTLPRDITSTIGISNFRIFASAENLLTFTALDERYDPETITGGFVGASYPTAKTISVGANITF